MAATPKIPIDTRAESGPEGRRPFVKMHGLRNHFVIVDARDAPWRPDPGTVRRLCDVQVGIGADQLVVIEPPQDDGGDAFMRIYNVDGREVEACGNATRCVAWLLLEERDVDEIRIRTLAGILCCRRSGDRLVTVDMGPVSSDWRRIPLSREVDTTRVRPAAGPGEGVALNVGNPHLVFFVDDLEAVDLGVTGPAVQADALFPEQVNVGVARVTGESQLVLRVYERGAGLTMACGSGACAAVRAAQIRGLVGDGPVAVRLPGGEVTVAMDDRGHAVMTGPVAYAYTGFLP